MNITDKFSRKLRDVRISVTNRCNFRCAYCMPKEIYNPEYQFFKKNEILSFEEIIRLSKIFSSLGTKKIRLTGGEPLLRKNIHILVKYLKEIKNISDISMTTNGAVLSFHQDGGFLKLVSNTCVALRLSSTCASR